MSDPGQTCPECGAARPRRAAGCPRCGAIFDTGFERGETSAASDLAAPSRSETRSGGGRRGCGACALLALIVVVLTGLAGVVLYFLARRELTPLYDQFQRAEAQSELAGLAERIEAFAARHDGRLPESLFEISQERSGESANSSLDLIDPWGGRYTYELSAPKGPARIVCLGADGQSGGEGPDADLEVVVPAR